MKHIPFSVAMSVYKNDDAVFFDRALQSITEEQTVIPDEIVLVVDGEVDGSIDAVIEKYSELYPDILKVIRLKENSGLGIALRVAVENCTHELIARMDSDDVAVKNRFVDQLAYFEKDESLDIVGGNISEFIGGEENIVSQRNVPSTDSDIKMDMKSRCAFNHMTVMFKKSAVQSVGGYQDWHYNEDYYLWLRMLLNGCNFANINHVLVNVRIGSEMYQRRGGIRYFRSEARLQNFMLENQIISFPKYIVNVNKRLIVQVLLPNKLRGWVFKKFARKTVKK